MNKNELDALCLAAQKRLQEYINRITAQAKRRMVEGWRKSA